uniref:Uncharacterized protein n=1 Tax=Sexangularia sp. CB-2014 TaxID=1486929 RepID=A0A7S1VPI1_9EUKA
MSSPNTFNKQWNCSNFNAELRQALADRKAGKIEGDIAPNVAGIRWTTSWRERGTKGQQDVVSLPLALSLAASSLYGTTMLRCLLALPDANAALLMSRSPAPARPSPPSPLARAISAALSENIRLLLDEFAAGWRDHEGVLVSGRVTGWAPDEIERAVVVGDVATLAALQSLSERLTPPLILAQPPTDCDGNTIWHLAAMGRADDADTIACLRCLRRMWGDGAGPDGWRAAETTANASGQTARKLAGERAWKEAFGLAETT